MKELPKYPSVQTYLNLFIEDYCYPKTRLTEEWNDWLVKRQDTEMSAKDFIWSMFNAFIIRVSEKSTSEKGLYQYQTKIAWDMLKFLSNEDRSTKAVRTLINTLSLKTENLGEYEVVAIVLADKCCIECKKINGNKYALEAAIKNTVIPYSGCTRPGGCNCCYIYETQRDDKGKIITKPRMRREGLTAKQRKPYNPNTTYGRRKLREQAQEIYNKRAPAEKARHNAWIWLIAIIILLIAFLVLGRDAFFKWAQR